MAAIETILYVSLEGRDSWSGALESPSADGRDGPFRSLEQAVTRIREIRAQNSGELPGPVRVYLREGTHCLREPMAFGPADSGTPDSPITFAAYPGETPVVSGGRLIENWTRFDETLWKADIPEAKDGNWNFRLLRVGDTWAVRARHPNHDPEQPRTGGWLFAKQPDTPSEDRILDRIEVGAEAFPDWQDWDGAEVHIFPAWGWVNAILTVDEVDNKHHRLHIQCQQDIRPGNRFFIANVREALDSPGEWYLDREAGELLYWPTEDGFPNVQVVAPAMDRLIVLQGDAAQDEFVEHIHFQGLTFSDTDYTMPGGYYSPADAVVWMQAARSCSLADCTLTQAGGYAVRMEERSSQNRIVRNTMTQLGQGGVILLGKTDTQCHDNQIAANTITDCGLVYKHVAGVYVTTGSGNHIAHNRIHRVPRYGISLKSYDPSASSHRNVVEFNEIVDSNLETNDTGAIETLGRDKQLTGNIIRFNVIRNVVGLKTDKDGTILSPHFTWGIYMDDYSSGTTVYGNLVVGTVLGGVCIHGGKDNVVENNILVDGEMHQIRLQPRDDFMTGNVFRRNVIVYRDPEAVLWYSYAHTWRPDRLAAVDHNVYWHTGPLDLSTTDAAITPEGSLQKWQAAGFDAHSVVTDPRFHNAEAGDFRLREDSPAFDLGFEPLPWDRVGPEGFE